MAPIHEIVVIVGQGCDPTEFGWDEWKSEWRAAASAATVSFWFPPKNAAGERLWHPYTPPVPYTEYEYERCQRADGYDRYLAVSGAPLIAHLDGLSAAGRSFAVACFSNGGTLGFEIACWYSNCRALLLAATSPVTAQQNRSWQLKCPAAFYHGVADWILPLLNLGFHYK